MLMKKCTSYGPVVMMALALVVFSAFAQDLLAQDAPAAETPREGSWVDFTFGTGVDTETRAVIGEATVFPADSTRVYCFTRIHGLHPPTTVTHAWYHDGKTMAKVDLDVRSENWRTWSYKTYLPEWTGYWEVKVLDTEGMVLGTAGFTVE